MAANVGVNNTQDVERTVKSGQAEIISERICHGKQKQLVFHFYLFNHV